VNPNHPDAGSFLRAALQLLASQSSLDDLQEAYRFITANITLAERDREILANAFNSLVHHAMVNPPQ
jgi:hypothetical protein